MTSVRVRARCAAIIAAAGLLMGVAPWAAGQNAPPAGRATARPPGEQGRLTVTGQRVGRPELRYRLLPRQLDVRKGNAAVKYLKAASELPTRTEADATLFDSWREMRREDLNPSDPNVARIMGMYKQSLNLAREGSLLESVDWETNVREKGAATLLPSLSKMRHVAQALALEARFDIRRKDWNAAQERIQTGYMLALHMEQGETLIESLVGLAIAGIMNQAVEDWISEPGSPNLYWPLSNLPAPFNDLRRAVSFEIELAYFSIPALRAMREGRYSPETWAAAFSQVLQTGVLRVNPPQSPPGDGEPPGFEQWKMQATAGALGVVMYPQAKRYLTERGRTPAEVEAMPVAEALERYFVDSWEEATEGMFKWFGVPPAQALAGLEQWQKEFEASRKTNGVNILAALMLPSVGRALESSVTLDRRIGALRLVEAVRDYAGEYSRLPERLEDLKLPVPVDPLGVGYTLRKEGDAVIIEAAGDRPRATVRYEVRLR